MPKKDLFTDRRFLNKGGFHSLAGVVGLLKYDELDGDDALRWSPLEASYSLSNCDRTISLEIDTYDSESLENSIFKMQQIEDVSRGLKEALMAAREDMKEWEEKHKEFKNKDKKDE